MAVDTTKRGAQDRRRVAGNQPYEVTYFARKHGISLDQVQRLIEQIRNDRRKLDQVARKLST